MTSWHSTIGSRIAAACNGGMMSASRGVEIMATPAKPPLPRPSAVKGGDAGEKNNGNEIEAAAWEGSGKTSRFDSDQSAAAPRAPVFWRVGRCARRGLQTSPVRSQWRDRTGDVPGLFPHGVRPFLGMRSSASGSSAMDARASRYYGVYARWQRDPQGFWGEAARDIDWIEPPKQVFDPNAGVYGRWFTGGVCNTCWNAVDRHVLHGRGEQPALIYDSPLAGQKRTISYH